jgi:hypothetical protein
VSLDQGRSYGGMSGVSYGGANRGSTDDCSVGAFAVKPRACGAPLCGFGA